MEAITNLASESELGVLSFQASNSLQYIIKYNLKLGKHFRFTQVQAKSRKFLIPAESESFGYHIKHLLK